MILHPSRIVPLFLAAAVLLLGPAAPAARAQEIHDLAVTSVRAPREVWLTEFSKVSIRRAYVRVENRGTAVEVFPDSETLAAAVQLITDRIAGPIFCPSPARVGLGVRHVPGPLFCLMPPEPSETFPFSLEPSQKMEVMIELRFTCGSNPDSEPDWEFSAEIDHAALDGSADANPADDVCPRQPLGEDPGCGKTGQNGQLAAPVTNVRDFRSSTRLLLPGPFAVGHVDLPLVDTSRPTNPNGTFPGAPERSLPTLVWYPSPQGEGGEEAALAASGAPYPMVIYSHGLGGIRNESTYFTTNLASHGYIVVATNYPLSNISAPGGQTIADTPNEAGDVTFLFDTFLAFNGEAGNRFEGAIDPDRLALAGLSGGGLTTLVAGYDSNVRDLRVKAALPMAPAACWFQQGYFGSVDVPLMLMHGDADLLVDIETHSAAAFERANPPKFFTRIGGGFHVGFSDAAPLIDDALGCLFLPDPETMALQTLELIEALGGAENFVDVSGCSTDFCSGDASHIDGLRQQQIAKQTSVAFFESILRGDPVASIYLEEELQDHNPEVTLQSVP